MKSRRLKARGDPKPTGRSRCIRNRRAIFPVPEPPRWSKESARNRGRAPPWPMSTLSDVKRAGPSPSIADPDGGPMERTGILPVDRSRRSHSLIEESMGRSQ